MRSDILSLQQSLEIETKKSQQIKNNINDPTHIKSIENLNSENKECDEKFQKLHGENDVCEEKNYTM